MKDYQKNFIQFAIARGVLKFGEFTLKSGRISPYFFNSGLFNSGASLGELGRFYAQALMQHDIAFDVLYGPAYKGIVLASATAIALADQYGRECPYSFNRKEAKDHGEGGIIVGSDLQGRIMIIDDVISAGTSVRESFDIIKQHHAEPVGVIIALDRQEKGSGNISAIREIESQYTIPVISIIRLEHLIDYLQNYSQDDEISHYADKISAYREQYGDFN